jgi:YD repeat-containing protein
MKTEIAYHKNSDVVKWERRTYSDGSNSEHTYNEQGKVLTYKSSSGYSFEYTYNEQGEELTYKHSDGYYAIKCKEVTKEEFEAFVNDDIIELNGVKYKRI